MANPGGVLGADLLPLSLIGCAIWDVMEILRKQRQPVRSLVVEALSEREEERPWGFRRITVVYRIQGTNVDRAAVERAVRLTEDKYCSTMATLRPAIEIVSEVELVTGNSEGVE
jgi:putative redox protein